VALAATLPILLVLLLMPTRAPVFGPGFAVGASALRIVAIG